MIELATFPKTNWSGWLGWVRSIYMPDWFASRQQHTRLARLLLLLLLLISNTHQVIKTMCYHLI